MLSTESYTNAYKQGLMPNLPPIDVQSIIDRGNEIAMYIVVRSDLVMSPGKVAAQVGHGVELALDLGKRRAPQWTPSDKPCTKIVLQANFEEFHSFISEVTLSKEHGNHVAVVVDEGRTEITPNTMTVAALIPMPRSEAQRFTSKLKRYK